MKKLFAMIMVLAVTAAMLAGCGSSSSNETTASGDKYGEGYEFKHGFDKDYPPYSYINDDGETSGFDVEMAQAVCDYYGWTYKAVPFNWDAKDAELNSGSCDCIWSGFTKSAERLDSYTWSQTYSDNSQMILVPEDSDIKTIADLAGKKVGVQTATSAYDLLQSSEEGGKKDICDTFASLEVYDSYTVAFNDLQAGAIDAIAIDVTTGNYQMSKQSGYKYLDEELAWEEYAIGFRKEDTELCEKVDAALEALAADGTMDEIGQKYTDIYDYLTMLK